MPTSEVERLKTEAGEVLQRMGRPARLFEVTPDRTVMLIIDMQDAFCATSGCIEIPDAREIVPRINRIASQCRRVEVPVVFIGWRLGEGTNRGLWPMFQPASPVDPQRSAPPDALTGHGRETRFFAGLDFDRDRDHIVWKRRYSPFAPRASRLPSLLRKMGRDTLLITGVGTNVCCESTARDAMMNDYRVVVVSDANATVSELLHEVTLVNIRLFFGDVVSTAEVLRELQQRGRVRVSPETVLR